MRTRTITNLAWTKTDMYDLIKAGLDITARDIGLEIQQGWAEYEAANAHHDSRSTYGKWGYLGQGDLAHWLGGGVLRLAEAKSEDEAEGLFLR